MTEREMIEKMAKAVANIHRCFLEDENSEILDDYIAEKLIEQGYCKIPEGAVVLTREEYEELQTGKDFDYGYREGESNMTSYYENIRLPEVRKETAREILSEMFKQIKGYENVDIILSRIAKQFGVEIKE